MKKDSQHWRLVFFLALGVVVAKSFIAIAGHSTVFLTRDFTEGDSTRIQRPRRYSLMKHGESQSESKPISEHPRARLTGYRRDVVFEFSPDGRVLATAGAGNPAKLWEVANSTMKAELFSPGYVSRLSFSPNGRTLETSSYQKTVRLWNVQNGKLKASLEGERDFTSSVAFTPDSRMVATASFEELYVRLWNADTGQLMGMLAHQKPYRYAKGVDNVAFTPDGKTLVTSSSRMVYLWDVSTRQVRITLADEDVRVREGLKSRKGFAHGDTVYWLAISPDGRTLATASRDNTAKLWDLATGKLRAILKHEHKVMRLTFSRDSNLLATGSEDKTARLWDVKTGNAKAVLKHRGTVWSVDFSPDSRLVATAADNDHSVKLWDVASGQLLYQLKEARYPVAFSPDGRTFATGGQKGAVLLWDVRAQ